MRKHPLLAFVTALISCTIPGTVTAAWADITSTANADDRSPQTDTAVRPMRTPLRAEGRAHRHRRARRPVDHAASHQPSGAPRRAIPPPRQQPA